MRKGGGNYRAVDCIPVGNHYATIPTAATTIQRFAIQGQGQNKTKREEQAIFNLSIANDSLD